ncbi:MAG: hypothetical protein K2X81_05845 [Candidatus Obscuribacterales bacterium]|nr:hypothetical protein [Candidatus Obscuribacterales bacterium]
MNSIITIALTISALTLTLFSSADCRESENSRTKTKAILIAQKTEQKLNRFENDIKHFEDEDKKHPPTPGGTVFIGSSTFTKWTELSKDLSEFKPINRGFGGSTIPEINHYAKRIVVKYTPSKIVFYAGTNDIAELNHKGKDIARDFQTFVNTVRTDLPNTDIYFISMSVAPCRLQWSKQYQEGNDLVKAYISSATHLHYIDVVPAMRNSKGQLRTELFGFDSLHMNRDGYLTWIPIIRTALKSSN